MVRGINSATIVPTASDDNGDGIPSRISHASISDEEAKDSSDVKANTLIAERQSKKKNHLQAAFNGQTSKTHPNPHDPSSRGPMNVSDGTTSNMATHKADEPPLQSNTNAHQQSVAPLIGKTLRQRSQSAVVQKQNGVALTKNYVELVRDFRQLRPFTRRPDGKYPADTLCVYCVNTRPTSVFFPCQHLCVCNDCIDLNHISTDYSSSTDWCACPVCMADIRLIVPHSGKEEEKYWKWVLEIKPRLPPLFKQEFRETGKRLNKNTTPARGRRYSIVTMFRRVPTAQQKAPKDRPPKPKTSVLGRRHSWQPGEVANVQNVAASNEQEEAHNCSIL